MVEALSCKGASDEDEEERVLEGDLLPVRVLHRDILMLNSEKRSVAMLQRADGNYCHELDYEMLWTGEEEKLSALIPLVHFRLWRNTNDPKAV